MQDSVTRYNLHDDKESTPYGTGYRQQHGLQVRGGTETRALLPARRVGGRGRRHARCRSSSSATSPRAASSLRPEQESPNHLTRVTARANLNIALTRNADVAVNAGYIIAGPAPAAER